MKPPPPPSDPFAASQAAMERAHAIARAFVAGLPLRPVGIPRSPQEMAAALDEPLPETSSDPSAAVAEWFARAESGIVASAGPRFFGYVVGGVTPAALAGDWLASAIDQCGGIWAGSPAAAQTELVVLRWLKERFELPSAWAGALTSGATMANLVGLAAARQWAGERLGFDPAGDGLAGHPPIPVVAGDVIHASAVKSLGTLGFGRTSLRRVAAPGGRVDLAALAAELAPISGPAIVIATAGEVNTGACDDLAAVADLCQEHPGGAWLHVDAAFGLFAAIDAHNRTALVAIQSDGRVFLTATTWDGKPARRAAFDNWSTTPADVAILQETVADIGNHLDRS